MPFPFGVSVGDFIACIELINTIINCLDQSHGSDARFRDVSRSLKSLEIALMEVNKITASSNDEVALRQVSMQCRSTLSTFLNKIKKYQPNLQLGGSGNHLMDNLRKVQWALYTKDDVAHFQLEIRGHVDSILILLGMLQREAKATVDEEIVHPPAPVVQDALERLQLFPTNNIPRFKIVQNVENVDVSSARMVSVLDLLGYMFLTAGGSVLDWTHDYVIVDDEDTELTPANWESGAHHGISVTLHLGNRDGLVALQDMLRSKIRGILSTSAPTFRGQGIRDVVEKVCLLVGASKAQFEIRNLVRDTGKLAPARGLHA
ncbi:hypothetical protein MBLNU13_g00377t2 [Cladosporium sp. NU13]